MSVYLFLILLFVLIGMVSIGCLLYGIIKKRKGILISGAILFILGGIGSAYAGFNYLNKTYQYIFSDEFQEDTKKGSEVIGKTIGSVSSGLSEGLTATLDEDAITELAGKSSVILGKSIKTIASGLDSTAGSKLIFIDKNLEDAGFELVRAEENYEPANNKLGVFISYQKDFIGKLKLTNYDQTGKKIDVAEKDIRAKAGEEKVEVFSFPYSKMGITTYYILSK